jgi:hypothetical protein
LWGSRSTRGYDAGKKVNGRKRFIVTDTRAAGAPLFDLTVYSISFAQMVLGMPVSVCPRRADRRRVDLEESVPSPTCGTWTQVRGCILGAGRHDDHDRPNCRHL